MVQFIFYSGKKKKHTIKYEIVLCPLKKKIIWIFGGAGGGLFHDKTLAENGCLPTLQPGQFVVADKAYVGCPQAITPIKRKRGQACLSPEEEQWNRLVNRVRIDIERLMAHFKKFACAREAWRHNRTLHPQVFGLLGELINIDLEFHPLTL